MDKHYRRLAWLSLLALLVTMACGVASTSTTVAENPGWAETVAVKTMSAMQTAAFLAITPTHTALPATQVPVQAPTQTPTITKTPTATNTPIPPLTQRPTNTLTATPTKTPVILPPTATRYKANNQNNKKNTGGVIYDKCTGEIRYTPCKPKGISANAPCLQAELLQDITIPSGQIIRPGVAFSKIWRIRNSGSCLWPADTRMAPISGNLWIGTSPGVGKNIKPGESGDFVVNLNAPATTGDYTGGWQLNLSDTVLLGPKGGGAFNVRIRVAPAPPGSILWDFPTNVCNAIWENNNCAILPCPGKVGSNAGFALSVSPATMENNIAYSPVLWTQPFARANGQITGTFAAFYVEPGDKLRSEVGCLFGYTSCHVRFELYAQYLNQSPILIAAAEEKYDNSTVVLVNDYNLITGSPGYVGFYFRVINLGDSGQAQGGWFNTRLYR
jgi:hypothetical protein